MKIALRMLSDGSGYVGVIQPQLEPNFAYDFVVTGEDVIECLNKLIDKLKHEKKSA